MTLFTATQSNWFLIGPIAWVLGQVMNWIYEFIHLIGLPNIGLAIILFTIVVKALLIPMSIKQQKTSRLQAIMQPELQAVQAKYKGKTDQASMLAQQQETKAIYAKYGTSMTGGCLQLLIQMPILFALYQVILKLPGYITKLKEIYLLVADKVTNFAMFGNRLAGAGLVARGTEFASTDQVVDVLYSFSPEKWQKFTEVFPNYAATYADKMQQPIEQTTFFLGIDLTRTPWDLVTQGGIWWAVLIPILAGLFQWLSTKLSTAGQSTKKDDSNPLGGTMNIMNIMFPILSVVFCFMFNGGIGLYWVASSLVQLIIQIFVNMYLKKVDLNEMVKKNVEKMNQKRIRRGQKPIRMQDISMNVQNLEEQKKAEEEAKRSLAASNQESTDYYASHTTARKGSLAEKAGMVQQYEERQKELRSGKKAQNDESK